MENFITVVTALAWSPMGAWLALGLVFVVAAHLCSTDHR